MQHEERLRGMAMPVRRIEEPGIHEAMKQAGLIWGCDTATDSVVLVYGREMLEDIAKGRDAEFDAQGVMAFALDFRADELEYLCVAVEKLRGMHCYRCDESEAVEGGGGSE